MDKKEKMRNYLQRDFEFLFVIALIDGLANSFYSEAKYVIVLYVDVLLLILGIYQAKKGGIAAGIIGLIVGVIMTLSGGLIMTILGIFMFLHSVVYLIHLSKKEN